MIFARLEVVDSNAAIKLYEKGKSDVQIVPDITTEDSAYMWLVEHEFKITPVENIFALPRAIGKGVLNE